MGTASQFDRMLTPGDLDNDDRFGISVGISGDYAVVGAQLDDRENNQYPSSGAIYVFKRKGANWVKQQKIYGSICYQYSCFGTDVAIEGSYIVVGTPDYNSSIGASFIYRLEGSSWILKSYQTGTLPNSRYGQSISLSGNRVVVSAPNQTIDSYTNKGKVYVITHNSGIVSNIVPLTGYPILKDTYFGKAVAISGDYLVIAERNMEKYGYWQAYIYKYDGAAWINEQVLQFDKETRLISAAISGDTIVIGTPCKSTAAGDDYTGKAYMLKHIGETWSVSAKLLSSDIEQGDVLGCDVACDGVNAIVGAYQADDNNGINTGAAYLFGTGNP